MVLFFIGIVEMIISTAWTKLVSKTKIFASGAVTMVNIFIWYYVLQSIIDDISNWSVIFVYALGCAIGTILTTSFFAWQEKNKRCRNRKRRLQPSQVEYDKGVNSSRRARWA